MSVIYPVLFVGGWNGAAPRCVHTLVGPAHCTFKAPTCSEISSTFAWGRKVPSIRGVPREGVVMLGVWRCQVCGDVSLNGCQLDIDLVKLLCEGLSQNKSIQRLSLSSNDVFRQEEAGQLLGDALARMPQMCRLSVDKCQLTDQSWQHIIDGICHQMEQLNCHFNELTSAGSEETMRRLLTQRPDLLIWARRCGVSEESMRRLREEFGRRFY
ncbi:hypothetical protein LSAT2_028686 [Lamellibrachia satsuma]|nr:hypothetical protein LSAT2_028686 [Lamellibrachia satsuma]